MSKQRRSKNAFEKTTAQTLGLRPEEFPLGSPQSRAAARGMLLKNQKRVTVIIACRGRALNLAASTCYRYICPDGVTVMEVVFFDGNAEELSKAETEEFILRHPIRHDCERNTYDQSRE